MRSVMVGIGSMGIFVGFWQWSIHHQVMAAMIFTIIFYVVVEYIFIELDQIKEKVTNGNSK